MYNRSFLKQSVAMNKAKERKRLESDPPDYPKELPFHRKTIIIINHDFGTEMHFFHLFKADSDRNDQYKVVCDGELWKNNICLSEIFRLTRKAMPRVKSIRS